MSSLQKRNPDLNSSPIEKDKKKSQIKKLGKGKGKGQYNETKEIII